MENDPEMMKKAVAQNRKLYDLPPLAPPPQPELGTAQYLIKTEINNLVAGIYEALADVEPGEDVTVEDRFLIDIGNTLERCRKQLSAFYDLTKPPHIVGSLNLTADEMRKPGIIVGYVDESRNEYRVDNKRE
jgi:hypothetical protein